jgi:mannosyltransferase OCH1-like enzyme
MIEKIIHQIWVGHYDIPERETALYKEIRDKHPDYKHILWTDDNLPEIPENFLPMYNAMYAKKDFVFCADMLRWLVIYQYGGWYLDIDWQYIKNLNEYILKGVTDGYEGIVFGHWGVGWKHIDDTIANNVFAFKKGHAMPLLILNNLPLNTVYSNAPFSPAFCGQQMRLFLQLSNHFTYDIWVYHEIIRTELSKRLIKYGDYNTFQNENFKHHSLFAWNDVNMKKFANGEIN